MRSCGGDIYHTSVNIPSAMGPSSFFRIVGFSKWFSIFAGRYARQQVCRRILGCFVLVVVVKDPFKFCSSVTMIVFYFGTVLIY